MNILDENIPEDQRRLVQAWGIPIRQIGCDIGRKGMEDKEIISFLQQMRGSTFFTRDQGLCQRGLCHVRYCLGYLGIEKDEIATFVRRLLHHPELNTKAKRMGAVIRVSHTGLAIWRRHAEEETRLSW